MQDVVTECLHPRGARVAVDAQSRILAEFHRGAGPTASPHSSDLAPVGSVIGRFRVVRELGRGGMGVVVLAHDLTLDRPVAIKLLHAADPDTLARFRLEALALAGLSHPNAVRVFESGEHIGRPYLAMEFVDGPSLYAALRDGPITSQAAAATVAAVAGAVHAAHQAGVAHRDLKPANVLIDAAGTPRLTDFGVARRLDGPGGVTEANVIVGTPQYMAPEQAAGRVPNARTDVYGLGATLYECLTGRPPFIGPTLEVLHQVAHDDPVPPRRLNRAVPADLEAVCLKCLEKDPARRYPTAAAVAEDLKRFLDGRPTAARPVGAIGRTARWCRRNRAVAVAVAIAAAALVGGATAAAVLAVQATAARDAEATARATAEAERANARTAEAAAVAEKRVAQDKSAELTAVNDFLLDDLLRQGSGGAQVRANFKPDPDLTVRTALDRAASKVGERFRGRPVSEEAVRTALGAAYDGVGEYDKAAEQLGHVLRLMRARREGVHPEVITHRRMLGSTLEKATRFDDARAVYEETLRDARVVYGPTHFETFWLVVNIGKVHELAGRPAEARKRYEEVVRLAQEHGGPMHPDLRPALGGIASAYRSTDRKDEAVPMYRELLRVRQATDGPDAPATIGLTLGLATLYHDMGRVADALPLYEDALIHEPDRGVPSSNRSSPALLRNLT